MAGNYQLTGTVKFGVSSADVDVSSDVYSCNFKRTYNGVEKPATFGSLRATTVAGSFSEELVVEYVSQGMGASAGTLDGLVNHVIFNTGTNTLYYEFTADGGSPSSSNPKITGTVSVLEWEHGGTAGELRNISQTFPVLTSSIAVA